jgi:hypothetical protein
MPKIVRARPHKTVVRPTSRHADGSRSGRLPSVRRKPEVEGWYDIRRGAAGYAPIIGAFGALSVPAIVFLFTVLPSEPHRAFIRHAPAIAFAGGLLIVVVVASLTGSVGLAAIGAERDATANLVPAAMFLAVAVSISLVASLAAFEALATLYLPGLSSTKVLFAVIVGVGGAAGAFFTALSIADSWQTGPMRRRELWRKSQWLQSYEQAYWWSQFVAALGAIPPLAGIVLRITGIPKIALTTAEVPWLVGITLLLSMTAVALGALRTRHSEPQKGLRMQEALATTLTISCYTFVLMLFLP